MSPGWPKALTPLAAALVWCTLGLRLYLGASEAAAAGASPLWGALDSLHFFTVLTTLLIALALSAPSAPRVLGFFARPGVNTLAAASILLVALVYTLLLRHLWEPQGLRKLVDSLLHDVIPLVFIAYWWLAVPKQQLRWTQLLPWLLYPALYLLAVLLRGLWLGNYPYPFVDVGALGYGPVALRALALLGLYSLLGAGLIALARWQGRRDSIPES